MVLGVGMVVHGGVHLETTASLLRLAAARPCRFQFIETTYIGHGRNLVVRNLGDADPILFVDADMEFAPEHVQQLEDALQANPKRGAVSAFYIKRDGSAMPVCNWRLADGWVSEEEQVGKAKILSGVNAVDSFGAGLLMISREALNAVGDPWFKGAYHGEEYWGEDTEFCQELIQKGFEPSVDFDCRVGHRGTVTWHPDAFYKKRSLIHAV